LRIIRAILQKLYIFWVFLVFTFFMLLFLPGLTLPFMVGLGWVGYAFLWIWSWIFSQLTFIRYKFYGRENIDRNKAYIYVSNHTSFLDLPGIRMIIPGQFRPLAKKELLKIPVFGWIAQSATIIVDRSSSQSRKTSMDKLKRILTSGISILIFPEGTQNRTRNILQPFHDGAFRIAIDTQQPIMPMVVLGAGRLMPPGTIDLRPGTIRIYVGNEISTVGLSTNQVSELKEQVCEAMSNMIRQNS
jgi:1-acyl-sn-glycerol-3-phosphate acyltransferase